MSEPVTRPERPKISILIKTLNEEPNIAAAIESCLAALAPYGGEVIVADSGSTDRTVAVARGFPVTVVQLADPQERCCGIGPELGFQVSRGRFVYILDGDMTLDPTFLGKALAILEAEPDVAGVGGFVRETRADNLEFKARVNRLHRRAPSQRTTINHLAGGGLYRRDALEAVGYMSDRNLHAFEEFDLGARLRAKGWRLIRLPDLAADHYAYQLGTWALLWHRIKSRSFLGNGEIVRAAHDAGYLASLLSELPPLRFALGTWLYWLGALGLGLVWPHPALITGLVLGLPALAVAVMAWRHGSLKLGVFSVALWHVTAVGLAWGALKPRRSPRAPVATLDLTQRETSAVAERVVLPAGAKSAS